MSFTRDEENQLAAVVLVLTIMFSIGVGLHFHSVGDGLIAFPIAAVLIRFILNQ